MEFKYVISKGRVRRVKTPEGSKFFGLPIGTPITPAALAAAKARHPGGLDATMAHEDRAPDARFAGLRTADAMRRAQDTYTDLPARRRAASRRASRRDFTYVDPGKKSTNDSGEQFPRGDAARARENYKAMEERRRKARGSGDDAMSVGGGNIRRGYGKDAGEYEALKNDMEATDSHEQVDEVLDKATRWHKEGGDDGAINAAELEDLKKKAAAKKRAISRGGGGRGLVQGGREFDRLKSRPSSTSDAVKRARENYKRSQRRRKTD